LIGKKLSAGQSVASIYGNSGIRLTTHRIQQNPKIYGLEKQAGTTSIDWPSS